jgi:hypothetical protein
MHGHIRICTDYDGMIEKLKCDDEEVLDDGSDRHHSSPVDSTLSARKHTARMQGRKAYNWLRIPVWFFAGGGILGVIIHRFLILPYSIIRKLPSVHSCLVLIGLALVIQLVMLCVSVRVFQDGIVDKDAKEDNWRSM